MREQVGSLILRHLLFSKICNVTTDELPADATMRAAFEKRAANDKESLETYT